MKKILLTTLLIATVTAQKSITMTGLHEAEYFDLKSKSVDETFRIYVAKPFPLEPNKKYPGIYVLDGNGIFGMAMDSQRMMALGMELPPAYIIGIGYAVDNGFMETMAKRWRDYTPTPGGELENINKATMDPTGTVEGGGGPDFLKFIQDELKPLIESKYSVDPNDATIAGISLGGLFPSWVLLTQPETFQRYIIMSPSIWWNGEEVWEWESHFAQNHIDINAKVFVTAGSLETSEELKKQIQPFLNMDGPIAEMYKNIEKDHDKYGWPKMAEITPVFVNKLKSRGYKNLKIHCHNMPDETHLSVGAGALSRGLRYVFDHWDPNQ
jgi:predicted alpha/beta superfamily hydrolase